MAANPVIPVSELKLETEKKNSETTVRGTGRITSDTSTVPVWERSLVFTCMREGQIAIWRLPIQSSEYGICSV
jgi:hypothetical protein